MKVLYELVYILKRHKIRSVDIVGDIAEDDSKLYQLYDAVKNKIVNTDLEAAQLIYNESRLSSKYRNLKHALKDRLVNAIYSIGFEGTQRSKAYQNSWKQWSVCKILMEESTIHTPLKIAQKISKQAIEYEFSDLVVSTSLYLRSYHALRTKKSSKFDYYNDLYKKYDEINRLQNLAHEYYMKLILDYTSKSVTVNPQIKEDAKKYYDELTHSIPEKSSTKFYHSLYQIQLLGEMGVFNYQKAKIICEEALHFFKDKTNIHVGGQLNYLLNKLVCHIQLKEFEEGKITAIECENLIKEEGSYNWFKAKECFFMLAIHTGNHQEAYHIYIDVIGHNRFKSYKSKFEETWQLYRMYVHFLVEIGEIVLHKKDKQFNNVRLGRFLNNVPSFSKDKRGMNIPVLIIQMAFLILQKKYDSAEEKIDALNKYCDRYLKTDKPNFRCNCFIKMLLQIPIAGFHKAGVERRAQRYYDKMITVDIDFNNQAHEVEVLPFESMWEFILNSLQNKFQKRKKR